MPTEMRCNRLLRELVAGCITLSLLFIIGNSAAGGETSGSLSFAVATRLNDSLRRMGVHFEFTNWFVRKTAHFIEYAALGFWMAIEAFLFHEISRWRCATVLLLCGVLIPSLDETLQHFVDGRNSAALDAAIDFGGMIAGCGCAIIARCLLRWVRSKIQGKKL